MSSVISARRRCEGRMSASLGEGGWGSVFVKEDVSGEEGLTSARIARGERELSMAEAWRGGVGRGALGQRAVALDMRRTMSGRTCFPSACV
jgi:hypothetical protein